MLKLERAGGSTGMTRDTSGAVCANQLFGQLESEVLDTEEGF